MASNYVQDEAVSSRTLTEVGDKPITLHLASLCKSPFIFTSSVPNPETLKLLIIYANVRQRIHPHARSSLTYIYALGEAVSYYMLEFFKLPSLAAENAFVQSTYYGILPLRKTTGIRTDAALATIFRQILSIGPAEIPHLPRSLNDNTCRISSPSFNGAIGLLRCLGYAHKVDRRITTIELTLHLLVSIVKRGNIDDESAIRLSALVESELSVTMPQMICSHIKELWNFLKRSIDETNVYLVVSEWTRSYISEHAAELREYVKLIPYETYEPMIRIKDAVLAHPYFNWQRIEQKFPCEVMLVNTALKELLKTPYMTYKRSQLIVEFNLYWHIAYVADTLNPRLLGLLADDDTTPVNFIGKEQLDDMISAYRNGLAPQVLHQQSTLLSAARCWI